METISLVGKGRGAHNKIKTHCPKGHALSGENVYLSSHSRECRTCRRECNRVKSPQKRVTRKTQSMNDVTASKVMTALRNGQTLNTICGGKVNGKHVQGVWITYYPLFRNYCASHEGYSREAYALLEINTKAATERKGARVRDRTHCINGHPFSGDNLYCAPGRLERKCMTCMRLRDKNPRPPSRDQIQQVTAALNAGKTINEICFGVVAGKKAVKPILIFRKLKLYRQQNPDFDRFVVSVTSTSNSRGQQTRHNPNKARVQTTRAQNDEYKKIMAMIPAYLAPYDRDAVAESISLALYDGSLRRDQVKRRLPEFVAAHNRDANKNGVGKFGLRSIDAPAYADGTTSYGETVSEGLWDY